MIHLALAIAAALVSSPAQAGTCPNGTVSKGSVNGRTVCTFAQKKYLNAEVTLTSDNDYLLEQGTYFGGDNTASSTLRIQAGTKILGNSGAFLVIMRGSKIFAEGTKANPIVFTSAKQTARKRGEWGGIVIN